MTGLVELYLAENQVSDLRPLSDLTDLEWLHLADNQISDASPLNGLTNLIELYLSYNDLSDVGDLVANAGIGDGDVIYLLSNPLSWDAVDTDIPILEDRGVTVYFGEVCVVLDPTDAGVGDQLNLTLYVGGEEVDLKHMNIWDVEMWDWEDIPAVIPELTEDMLAASGWHIEFGEDWYGYDYNEGSFPNDGTFADAIAAGGFGDSSCDFLPHVPLEP
jgi:Leucine-rich repeat (LRR) protein